jgi:hypothetical protein
MGMLRAIIDAIGGEVNKLAGRAVTRLREPLLIDEETFANVESTRRFGVWDTDGEDDVYRLLINGEIVYANGATSSAPFSFSDLSRGQEHTTARSHPAGSLVIDMSENVSAVDLTRRGFFVRSAIDADLDVIARNLGLPKCPGLSDDQWRRIIIAVAYLPKQPMDAFRKALEALTGDTTTWNVYERLVNDPWTVYVEILTALATDIRGRMVLTGGYQEMTDSGAGGTVVMTNLTQLRQVFGVYPDTLSVRRGKRDGVTNYYSGGGTFTPGTNTITLGSTPGADTPVIVDACAYPLGDADPNAQHHYLALDETVLADEGDRWAYLADPLRTPACVLDHVRPAGVRVSLRAKLP